MKYIGSDSILISMSTTSEICMDPCIVTYVYYMTATQHVDLADFVL